MWVPLLPNVGCVGDVLFAAARTRYGGSGMWWRCRRRDVSVGSQATIANGGFRMGSQDGGIYNVGDDDGGQCAGEAEDQTTEDGAFGGVGGVQGAGVHVLRCRLILCEFLPRRGI
jgi:hypothetical protein